MIHSIAAYFSIKMPRPVKLFLKNILNWIREIYLFFRIMRVRTMQKKALQLVRTKDKVKVVFLLIHDSMWKYDGIYKLMENIKQFDLLIVICPNIWYGDEFMFSDMKKSYDSIFAKGYKVVKSYNDKTEEWLDVKKEIQPDLVFFSNPHNCSRNEYYITNFLDNLTFYVPYGIMVSNIQQLQYNQLFHNLLYRGFYETDVHKVMAEKYSINKGRNIVVTGFPMCDVFLDKTYIPKDVWKNKDNSVKRIIWAPHHSIEVNEKELAYSNFLSCHQFMIDIIEKNNLKIQIAFKPHPLLKVKLYKHKDWGKERTDAYYKYWHNMNNGQLEENEYEDLFLTSDALIFDSISFVAEYCYTCKPSLFMVRDSTIEKKFNEFGTMAFNILYKSYTLENILDFIKQTVLIGEDPLLNTRVVFFNKYLVPPNNCSASVNILNNLLSDLKNEIHI